MALMLREARTRYGRMRLGYLWALLEPIMHISIFYMIFAYTLRVVPLGHSLVIFLATGLGSYLGFQRVFDRTASGYASNEALLSYPIVKVLDTFLGRALLELATWIASTTIIIGSLVLVGDAPAPRNMLIMLLAMLSLFLIGFGLGVFLGILAEFAPSLDNILRVPFRILYFTSGGFFLPDALPPGFRHVVSWNPIMHAITLFREGYYPHYDSHVLDIRYLTIWSVSCLLLALVTVRVAERMLRSRS